MNVITAISQVGISPKVKLPTLLLFVLGAIILILGLLVGDSQLVTIGLSAIGASGVTFGGGWAAKPGQVVLPAPQGIQTSPGFTITQAPAGATIVPPNGGNTISAAAPTDPPDPRAA